MDDLGLVEDQSLFHHVASAVVRRGPLSIELAAASVQRGTVEPLPDAPGRAFRETRWFSLPSPDVEFVPQPGDLLEESSERVWTLAKVEVRGGGSRYRCQGVRTAFAGGSAAELEIQAAAVSQDATGAVVRRWPTVGMLTAVVVPGTETLADEHGQVRPRGVVEVLFAASPIPLQAGMRLVEGGSIPYAVLSVEPPQELAGLWKAKVASGPWPRPEK